MIYEDFLTVVTQIEAVIDSRLLCPLSSSPDHLVPLTPAHFSVGRSLTALSEKLDYEKIPDNRLKRYELLQKMVYHFWSR